MSEEQDYMREMCAVLQRRADEHMFTLFSFASRTKAYRYGYLYDCAGIDIFEPISGRRGRDLPDNWQPHA